MAQEVTNFARFYGILKKSYSFATKELGEEFKEGLVSQFTNGRTTSLRDMSRKEYVEMCDKLEGKTEKLLRTARDEQRIFRSRCLNLMQRLGMDTTDWARVNAFCQHPRIAGKEFAALGIEELQQLSVKLRAISRKGGLNATDRVKSKNTNHIKLKIIDNGTENEESEEGTASTCRLPS